MIVKLKSKGDWEKKITNYTHTHIYTHFHSFSEYWVAAVCHTRFRHEETTCLIQRPDPQGVKTIDFLGPENWRIIK